MKRRTKILMRPLAGATIATLTAIGLGPAATTPPRASSPTINPRQTFSTHWHGSGTLVALHAKQGTGDLAEADGTLIPLRFSSHAQMQHVTLGDDLTVSADAHGHSRLIVRSLSRRNLRAIGTQGSRRNLRAVGVESSRRNLRVYGVVARLLGHGQAEVLGVNGAAVIVDARTAHIVGGQYTATGAGGALFAPSIAAAASLERPRPLALGEAIDTQVIWSHAKTMVVTTASVVATRVTLIDVEGAVTCVNRAGGTVTLVDENGLSTVVHLGAAVKTYRVGQDAEASGAPAGNGQLQARAVERESVPATSAAPPRETKTFHIAHPTATGVPTAERASSPVARDVARGAPTSAPRVPAVASPVSTLPVSAPTSVPTAAGASIPTVTATNVPANTATNVPANTATNVPANTATNVPANTATATSTASATATAIPTSVMAPASCAVTTPTPVDTSSDPSPAPIQGAPQGLKAQYQVGDPGKPCDAYIAPMLRIVNGGDKDVSLKDLTVRYWFTAATKQPQNWFSGPVGPGTATVHPLTTPVHGADAYVEIGFSDKAGAIGGRASLDLSFQLCKPGASNNSCPSNPETFDEYDDYSYNPFMTSFADWDRVTLYYQGKLIWGAEPR
jgi:hypothetical protein